MPTIALILFALSTGYFAGVLRKNRLPVFAAAYSIACLIYFGTVLLQAPLYIRAAPAGLSIALLSRAFWQLPRRNPQDGARAGFMRATQ